MTDFEGIIFDQKVLGGKVCIRGMRVTVALAVNLVANEMTTEQVIGAYTYLEPDDVRQALRFAAWLV